MLGVMLSFYLGGRAARDEAEGRKRAEESKDARRAARQAARETNHNDG